MTREMPLTDWISLTIFLITSRGRCLLGVAGTPVMKSWVMKVRTTTQCWHEGWRLTTSRSKCRGSRMTGIWDSEAAWPEARSTCWARWSHCRSVLSTSGVRYVGVTSCTGNATGPPNTYTTLLMLWQILGMSLASRIRSSQLVGSSAEDRPTT
uniref:Putative secreted protein n=1 Tax=Ixodes ricinus TaxID=34613 RepID=A0A6B0UVL0_IXORI